MSCTLVFEPSLGRIAFKMLQPQVGRRDLRSSVYLGFDFLRDFLFFVTKDAGIYTVNIKLRVDTGRSDATWFVRCNTLQHRFIKPDKALQRIFYRWGLSCYDGSFRSK